MGLALVDTRPDDRIAEMTCSLCGDVHPYRQLDCGRCMRCSVIGPAVQRVVQAIGSVTRNESDRGRLMRWAGELLIRWSGPVDDGGMAA